MGHGDAGEHERQAEYRGLLAAIAAGDQSALRRLYDRHAGLLLHIARELTGSRETAEEVVQDVFIRCWEKAGTYTPDRGTPTAWLAGMTRNRAIDHLRRSRAQRRGDGKVASLDELRPDAPAPDSNPGAHLEMGEVARALRALAPSERVAILLAVLGGLTHQEVADVLDAPAGTVKSWIRRGLIRLRSRLEPEEGLTP